MSHKLSPELSVVIVTLGGQEYIPRCLNAFKKQKNAPEFEIVIPCDERFTNINELKKKFPKVKFVQVDGRLTYAELRAIGFREASGKIVALTEDHCSPAPNWCSQIMSLHQNGVAAVGGAVNKEGADSLLNWAVYLSDFGRYMNPISKGSSEYLTDCNVSYKKEALEEISEIWQKEFHETTINWTLRDRGKSLFLSPNLVVNQQRSLSYRYALQERYAFGRLFASTRVAAVSHLKRLVYAGFSVFLPVLFVARVAKNVISKKRAMGKFIQTIPIVFLLGLFWAWGELLGYLTGKPDKSLKVDY